MRAWWILTITLAVAGCAGHHIRPARATLHVSSPAFAAGGAIPARYTCQGQDVSLPLRWSGVPRGARELDLVMRDRDAPGGDFIHWRLGGIPASARGLATGQIPPGAKAGRNDFGKTGYGGPCPPRGRAHHYVITVTARTGTVVYGAGTLVGTYARR